MLLPLAFPFHLVVLWSIAGKFWQKKEFKKINHPIFLKPKVKLLQAI